MIPHTRTLLGYLISILGLVILLLVVGAPYLWVNNEAYSFHPEKQLNDSSSIRFSEQRIRLESVHSGVTASGSILVENTGNKIITNAAIKAGCICTGATLSATRMNPDESIKVEFSIDTKGKYEDFVENILFTYSEGGQNLFDIFYVTVPILAPGKLLAEPASLQFSMAKVGESFFKDIELKVKDLPENESIDIIDVSLPDWIASNLKKKEGSWSLTLTGTFSNKSGRHVEFVQIKTNSTQYSKMIIPVIVEYATDTGSVPP